MIIDYKVSKTEDCALIDVNKWISTSDIIVQNIRGRLSPSYVTKVIDENFKKDYGITKGDTILITKVSAEVAPMRSYDLDDGKKYFNLPISQIIGKFDGREIALGSLQLILGKVLIEKIDNQSSCLYLPKASDTLGKVIKVNSKMKELKEGCIVLLKDNITTPIRLEGKEYYAADDINIVGILKGDLSIDNIIFVNESILMKPYHNQKLLGSSFLVAPDINYEDLDYSDVYNRDLFQIKFLDKELKELKKEDIILAKRDYTNYVYINDEKYFLLNGKKYVVAKLEE